MVAVNASEKKPTAPREEPTEMRRPVSNRIIEAKRRAFYLFTLTNYTCFVFALIVLIKSSASPVNNESSRELAGHLAVLGAVALASQLGKEAIRFESALCLFLITIFVTFLITYVNATMACYMAVIAYNLSSVTDDGLEYQQKLALIWFIGEKFIYVFMVLTADMIAIPGLISLVTVVHHYVQKRRTPSAPLLEA